MGNLKYPLNGRQLTLEDLVSEFAFNTEILYDKDDTPISNHDNTINDIVTSDISFISTINGNSNNTFYNEYNYYIDNISYNDLDIIKEEIKMIINNEDTSVYVLNSDSLISLYKSFNNLIMDENQHGKANNAYELCYFPTVYSDKLRTNDNKKYKIIQAGDDEKFAPDKYIKFKNLFTISNKDVNDMRPISLFHYIYDDNPITIGSDIDSRVSFKYKLDNGEAAISYAIRLLYKLDISNVSINNSNLFGFIEYNTLEIYRNSKDILERKIIYNDTELIDNSDKKYTEDIIDKKDETDKPKINKLQTINNKNIINLLLFGKDENILYKNNENKDSSNFIFYILSPDNDNDNKYYIRLIPSLLYDVSNNLSNIINTDSNGNVNISDPLSIFAYKYLCNANIRNKHRYKLSEYKIIALEDVDNNTKYANPFNECIRLLFYPINSNELYKTAYYDIYDQTKYQNVEDVDVKKANVYWKLLYYCQMIALSQLYYTGIILDAVYDVINELHLYINETPLYRCDIGTNTNITGVEVLINMNIDCLYGLPAIKLDESDAIINVNIPVRVYTPINTKGTDSIYNKKWTINQIKSLLFTGIDLEVEIDETTGKRKNVNATITYEYMKIYNDSGDSEDSDEYSKLLWKTRDDINIGLSANMGTYIIDTKRKSPIVTKLDPSLGVWDSKINPSWNVDNNQYINLGDDAALFLRGTLFAHINYSGTYFIDVEFPIKRLLNYYTESKIELKRIVNLYLIDPGNSLNIDKVHAYNTDIKYNFEDSNTLSADMYYTNLNNKSIWLYSYSGSATLYKFMSGSEISNTYSETSETYTDKLYVYDKEINHNDANLYKIDNFSENDTFTAIFNKGDDLNQLSFILKKIQLDKSYNVTIYNKCTKSISILYKSTGHASDFDNKRNIFWTDEISIDKDIPITNIDSGELYLYSYNKKLVLSKNSNSVKFTFINNYGNIITDEDSYSCSVKNNLIVYIYDLLLYKYSIQDNSGLNLTFTSKYNLKDKPNILITEYDYNDMNRYATTYIDGYNDDMENKISIDTIGKNYNIIINKKENN